MALSALLAVGGWSVAAAGEPEVKAAKVKIRVAESTAEAPALELTADTIELQVDLTEAGEPAKAEVETGKVAATHKQTKIIKVNVGDLELAELRSFSLAADGTVLAACGSKGGGGEVRRFTPEGEYLDTWKLSFDPEAINVGSDGYVYVAGDGKVMRLSADGAIDKEAEGPHVSEARSNKDAVREKIIAQQKQMVGRYEEAAKRYKTKQEELQKAAELFKKNGVTLSNTQNRLVENAKRMHDQYQTIIEQFGGAELSEEELEQRVAASIKSSSAVASISETGGEVFIATREPGAYTFCVWRMNSDFEEGEIITKGLRGCCGQMDVQCCENGVYVAENSRHRVFHVSRTGEEKGAWGKGAREGLEGFGSCCNPMNVCFGPEGSVYTAESGTGRIKRYSSEGDLLELVGKVDIVPGCKKVSIAADKSGDRVYMLDITRHHIVMMERLAEGEAPKYTETTTEGVSPAESASTGEKASVFRVIGRMLGSSK